MRTAEATFDTTSKLLTYTITYKHKAVAKCSRSALGRGTRTQPQNMVAAMESSTVQRHDFRDGRARYEETPSEHHDHLIDIQSGRVIEFHNDEIEDLQRRIAEKAGYRLVGHRLELFGVPLDGKSDRQK